MRILTAVFFLLATQNAPADSSVTRLEVWPESIDLSPRRHRVQVVVTGFANDGTAVDLTRAAAFELSDKAVAIVENEIVSPLKNGEASLTVNAAELQASGDVMEMYLGLEGT